MADLRDFVPNKITDFLTDREFCSLAIIDVEDTMNKLSDVTVDLALVSMEGEVNTEDFRTMYDPINHSLSPLTFLDNDGFIHHFSNLNSSGIVIPNPGTNIKERICFIFDITEAEIAESGLLGMLKQCAECDPTKSNLFDIIKTCSYLQGIDTTGCTSISDLLDLIDNVHPSFIPGVISLSTAVPTSAINELVLSAIILQNQLKLPEGTDWREAISMGLTSEQVNELISSFSSQIDYDNRGVPITSLHDCLVTRIGDEWGADSEHPLLNIFNLLDLSTNELRFFSVPVAINSTTLNNLLFNISECASYDNIMLMALRLGEKASSTVADISSALGMHYNSSSSKVKGLIRQLSNSGNNSANSAAAGINQTYKVFAGNIEYTDDHINWNMDKTGAVYDTTISSVWVGSLLTAAQVVGQMMLFGGELLVKLGGFLLSTTAAVLSKIQHGVADIANTYPDLTTGTIDQLVNYPLVQKTHAMLRLPDEVVSYLESSDAKACKLVSPFYVMFIYNYDSSGFCDFKLFINLAARGRAKGGVSLAGNYYTDTYYKFVDEHDASFIISQNDLSTSGTAYFHRDAPHQFARKMMLGSPEYIEEFYQPASVDDFVAGSNSATDYTTLFESLLSACVFIFWMTHPISDDLESFTVHNASYLSDGWNKLLFNPFKYEFDSDDAKDFLENNPNAQSLYNLYLKPLFVYGGISMFGGFRLSGSTYTPYFMANSNLSFIRQINLSGMTDDNLSWILNGVLPCLYWWLNHNSGSDVSNLFYGNTFNLLSWGDIDTDYAIILPKRSYKALVFAEVLSVVIVTSILTAVLVSKVVLKKFVQPKLRRRISDIEDMAGLIKTEGKLPDETQEHYDARIDSYWKDLYRYTNKFNFVTRILGMGGFDLAAGFWDGPSTIGGNWGGISDAVVEGSEDHQDSIVSRIEALSGSTAEETTVIGENVEEAQQDLDSVIALIKGPI